MQIKPSTIIWAVIFVVLITFLYLVNSILMPFVFGAVVAYFLDPVVDKVEELSLSRTISTIIVLVIFAIILGGVIFLLGPIFMEQFKNLAANIPVVLSEVEEKHAGQVTSWIDNYAPDLQEKIKDFFYRFSVQIVQATTIIVRGIITSGGAVINFLSLLIVSPIIAFYLLRDYDRIVKKIDNLLPRNNLVNIRGEFLKVDETISAYIRGQVTVCVVMAIFYSTSLNIINLNYAIAIGVITGALTFIPYAGMAIGMAIGLAVSYFQFGFEGYGLLLTLGVFAMGNFLEGTFITPNLVGNKVRLHPAWIIFALLAGGSLMGFTGVLVAIPVSAILGVLVRTSVDKYKRSSLYLGYPIMQLENPNTNQAAPVDSSRNQEQRVERANSPKRGRGRPRKSDAERVVRRPIDDSPKKKRGRPKKSD